LAQMLGPRSANTFRSSINDESDERYDGDEM
jgi:hypothetical protein